MEDMHTETHTHARRPGLVMASVERIYDFIVDALRTIAREGSLFIGVAFTVIGLLSFQADKFCDGNTADYLSCTRPSTYYFYSPFDIAIVVIGMFLILIWILNRRRS